MNTDRSHYPLWEYFCRYGLREHPILAQIRKDTALHPLSVMQIPPEQGQLLDFLMRLLQPQRVLEIGCFTGYSSTCMGLALGPSARLVTLEIDPSCAQQAQHYWRQANISERLEVRLGPALESLSQIPDQSFDFIFIDADKGHLMDYYEHALRCLVVGGVAAIDNVLWSGRVAQPEVQDPDTMSIRALNSLVVVDPRVDMVLLPVADGLTLVRKKG
jgi:predicted O-methyltransferase YrrM